MKTDTALLALTVLAVAGWAAYAYLPAAAEPPRPQEASSGTEPLAEAEAPETIIEGLDIPWEIAFLPDGDLLVTERPGRLLRIGADRKAIPVAGVAHRGEGGLLGLALHPRFAENGFIYLYLTTASGDGLINRVERYTLDGAELTGRKLILGGIPGAAIHDGGRLAFGPASAKASAGTPDYYLYITTGDAGNEDSAQDTNSLAGKILRVRDDGSIPSDNPFASTGGAQAAAIYSYGHRNVQGLAWDDTGELFATEHGRSGIASGYDELNKIVKGANYGWPEIQGGESRACMRAPEAHSGPDVTWAPSGMTYLNGHLIFAGLRGEALYISRIAQGRAEAPRAVLQGGYGRLRAVAVGPRGMLYVLTNNRDGRGAPRPTDDRLLRFDPKAFGIAAEPDS